MTRQRCKRWNMFRERYATLWIVLPFRRSACTHAYIQMYAKCSINGVRKSFHSLNLFTLLKHTDRIVNLDKLHRVFHWNDAWCEAFTWWARLTPWSFDLCCTNWIWLKHFARTVCIASQAKRYCAGSSSTTSLILDLEVADHGCTWSRYLMAHKRFNAYLAKTAIRIITIPYLLQYLTVHMFVRMAKSCSRQLRHLLTRIAGTSTKSSTRLLRY